MPDIRNEAESKALELSKSKKEKAVVPGKFLTKHLVKSPFKFSIAEIPEAASKNLLLIFFENLNSCVSQVPEPPKKTETSNKRIIPSDLIIGLGQILRILQRHVASPTEFPLPLRLILVCNKDTVSDTLLNPLIQLISMLQKPGTFGAISFSENDARKLASCLSLPHVMVVGIKSDAASFGPFIQEYVSQVEAKSSPVGSAWLRSIKPVGYLPLETNQLLIPVIAKKPKND